MVRDLKLVDLEALERQGIGFASSDGFDVSKSVLVMVHGAGGSSEVWRSQINALSKYANTLAVDLPGHGKTRGPGMKSIEEYSQWLCGVIEEVFQRSVFLMGHSMGGAITQVAAHRRPDLFRGIVLSSTGPRLRVAPQFLKGLLEDFDNTVERFLGYAYAQDASKEIIREGIRLMKEARVMVVHDDLSACNQFDATPFLASIKTRCLIICGDQDALTPPALSAKLKDSIKGSDIKLIPGAGHTVMIERPSLFNEAVAQFLGEFT